MKYPERKKLFSFVIAGSVAGIALLFLANLAIVRNNPGGEDFLIHWHGIRGLIKDGIDPYSDIAAETVKSLARANLLSYNESDLTFKSPLISIIFYAPFSLIGDFIFARAIWMTLLEFLAIAIGILAMWVVRLKKPILIMCFTLLFTTFGLSTISNILTGIPYIVSLFFLFLALFLILKSWDDAAGVFLAISLIKPDIIFLPVIFILVWSIITNRSKLIWWFLGSISVLIGFTLLLVPDWPVNYLQNTIASPTIIASNTLGYVEHTWGSGEIGKRLGLAKDIILGLLLIYEWLIVRNRSIERLVWLTGITLIFSVWFGNRINLLDTIFVIPALVIGLNYLWQRWTLNAQGVYLFTLLALLGVPWLFSGSVFPDIPTFIQKGYNLFLPPISTAIILYWVRWWVMRSSKFGDGIEIKQ